MLVRTLGLVPVEPVHPEQARANSQTAKPQETQSTSVVPFRSHQRVGAGDGALNTIDMANNIASGGDHMPVPRTISFAELATER